MKKTEIKNRKILLSHGSGGIAMSSLIKELMLDKFDNPILRLLTDSAVLKSTGEKNLCFTTDSYVVNPLFFPGGDIGTLAVNGTVNDLSVMGAKPLYISCSFILEEGLDWEILDKITTSMAKAARSARVQIVTGDTKVVEKGSADKAFINTSGVGILQKGLTLSKKKIKPGDKIIINGEIGSHGLAVMSKRENFKTNIKSDCAPLWELIESMLIVGGIKFMRDPTRGGVATVLCEIAEISGFGIKIDERKLPIHENVYSFSEILGLDPLYVANEGKVIAVTNKDKAAFILSKMKKHALGKEASIIGEITKENKGKVVLETIVGGERIVDRLVGDQLPRIC
ncbi:hydrogenase expression/formation protein HypE [candidate division WOR-3 bacterium]|nr:hydrogenase expression/formation protein HypE [candidate division WOR-3 bacterium]